MTAYAGNILDAVLGEYAELGFSLKENDDHITELYFKEKLIAYFNQAVVTVEILRFTCRNYIDSLNGEAN